MCSVRMWIGENVEIHIYDIYAVRTVSFSPQIAVVAEATSRPHSHRLSAAEMVTIDLILSITTVISRLFEVSPSVACVHACIDTSDFLLPVGAQHNRRVDFPEMSITPMTSYYSLYCPDSDTL